MAEKRISFKYAAYVDDEDSAFGLGVAGVFTAAVTLALIWDEMKRRILDYF